MPPSIVLVKLGGSLITDKARPGIARLATIRRLAREIASLPRGNGAPRLVLGHGSGSFGHVAASQGGVGGSRAKKPARADGIARTQHRAAELHAIVIDALDAAGAKPFSLAPSSFMTCSNGRVAKVFSDPLFHALDAGLVPVVYGDVVLDRECSAVVVSTEEVFVALARAALLRGVPVARAVWLGETDGLVAKGGDTVNRLTAAGARSRSLRVSGASGVDVTGGMALRLRSTAALARRSVPSLILDGRRAGSLALAVAGRMNGGTRVVAR
ncbi:MAG TPA: isopentenyl phosphate kinase [Candidatus Polarisedimenticolaceae bacterium]|nr:isopentenyl phosphate kinase [Candidatus Polarisedimenticolaceae bacterium]